MRSDFPAAPRPAASFENLPSGFAAGYTTRAVAPDGIPPAEVPRRLARALGSADAEVVRLVQVHGRDVIEDESAASPGADRVLGSADAVMSRAPGRLLSVFTADCLPVLLVDAGSGWMAAVHAGWRGTASRILDVVLDRFESRGVALSSLYALFGPSISGPAYEVGPDVEGALRASFSDLVLPEGAVVTGRGDRSHVDLGLINEAALLERGVLAERIRRPPLCTLTDPLRFPSYRRDGARTGRIATGILRTGPARNLPQTHRSRKEQPMKLTTIPLLGLVALTAAAPAAAQFQAPYPSPKQVVTQTIGVTDVSVSYSRPLVKGRKIWGDLVPFDKPWRTGANQATTVTFGDDVTVEGKKLAAGTYALVTIPGKDEWTVAFNLDTALWYRTDYNEALDVLRVRAKPQAAEFRESFEIGFRDVGPDTAKLVVAWEKLAVPVNLQVDTKGKAVARAREAVAKAKIDDWETPLAVARYFSDEKVNGAEAMALVDKSITIKKGWGNVSRKARMLAQEGKLADAARTGDEAVQLAKASPEKPNTEALEKLVAEWKSKK